jgi:hypothetical protein
VGLGGGLRDVGEVLLGARVADHDGLVTGQELRRQHRVGDLPDRDVPHGEVALGGEDVRDDAGRHGEEGVHRQLRAFQRQPVEQLQAVLGDPAGGREGGAEQHPHPRPRGHPLADRVVGGLQFGADVAAQRGVGALDHQTHRPHGFDHVGDQVGGLVGGDVPAVEVGHDHVVVPGDLAHVLRGHRGHAHPGPGEPGTGGVRAGEVVCDHEDLGHDTSPSVFGAKPWGNLPPT